VPPNGAFGSSNCRRAVHLYTARQRGLLLDAAGKLRPDFRAATYKTLLALLSCTGLRISEALKLQVDDFDPAAATLLIRRSKFGQSRIVPLRISSVRALVAYQGLRQRYCAGSNSSAFFLSPQGEPIPYGTIKTTFTALRRRLGWFTPPVPRLHDLRHTFTVNCLTLWQNQRDDALSRKILALGTYLGHRNIQHTYWYLSATPQLLAFACQQLPVCPVMEAANE
jgi:integrase